MRKKNLTGKQTLLLVSFITLTFASNAFSTSTHLEELRSKFPYGLLNDDHEILTPADLAKNACGRTPVPFPPSEFGPYEYWQCFESKRITFDCDSNGKPDPYEGVMGLVVIKASGNGTRNEYIEHRLWPIRDCNELRKGVVRLLKQSPYACISGSFDDIETEKSGRRTVNWMFDRIKTRKGCEGRDCDFTKEFEQENCPNLKWQ